MPNVVKIAKKIAQGACRYCIAPWRWCILISSFFLFTSLSKSFFIVLFATYSVNVNFRDYSYYVDCMNPLFHAITGLPHTHALFMTQDVVRYVKMRTGAVRGLERYKIVAVAWLVVEFFYVRERSLYSIRSLILSQWREVRRGVMWQVLEYWKQCRQDSYE